MPAPDDLVNIVSRLEAALARIAARSAVLAHRRPDPLVNAASTEITEQLDKLIKQLRIALTSSD
jgi:hypothetical protein